MHARVHIMAFRIWFRPDHRPYEQQYARKKKTLVVKLKRRKIDRNSKISNISNCSLIFLFPLDFWVHLRFLHIDSHIVMVFSSSALLCSFVSFYDFAFCTEPKMSNAYKSHRAQSTQYARLTAFLNGELWLRNVSLFLYLNTHFSPARFCHFMPLSDPFFSVLFCHRSHSSANAGIHTPLQCLLWVYFIAF